ncbi:MAG TPA: hypothetical protein VFJ58_19555 [Armatimonadota bacterium]|nr:hypothetical protein [Armatimonadota bacterium]
MAETITIHFAGNEVGVQYQPGSPEATFRDEMRARELALNALAAQAIDHRTRQGIRVPAILASIVEARTFLELP